MYAIHRGQTRASDPRNANNAGRHENFYGELYSLRKRSENVHVHSMFTEQHEFSASEHAETHNGCSMF